MKDNKETKINKKNLSLLEKHKGESFASIAEKIGSKYRNRAIDLTEQNSFEFEMGQLAEHQEKVKLVDKAKEVINQFKKGGMLPAYAGGGLLPPIIKPVVSNQLPENPFTNRGIGIDDYNNIVGTGFQEGILGLPPLTNPVTSLNPTEVPSMQYTVPDSGPTSTEPNPVSTRQGMSAYAPALIGQGISTAINAGLLLGGYDKEAPVTNPNASQAKNLMNRSIDTTQQRNEILSMYQAGRENLKNVRSTNVRNALDANLMNISQDNLAQSKLQEQQINNSYKGEYANLLNNLGQQDANTTVLANENTARNKGQFQSNLSALGTNVAENAKFFTTQKLNTIQNKLMGDILNTKYQEFGLNKEVVDRLSAGQTTPEDLIVLKSVYGEEAVPKLIESFKRTN